MHIDTRIDICIDVHVYVYIKTTIHVYIGITIHQKRCVFENQDVS